MGHAGKGTGYGRSNGNGKLIMGEERISGYPKCFGKMFIEDGMLRYGSICCDEDFCEYSKECRTESKGRR